MTYSASTSVSFDADPGKIYRELINLGQHRLWNTGLVHISETGNMREGMRYQTVSIVLGQETKFDIEVTRLVPNKQVSIVNSNGALTFEATYLLVPVEADKTNLECKIDFMLDGFTLNLAHPVIEAMATARIKGDLETLRSLLAA